MSNHDENYLLFDLKGPKQYMLGMEITIVKLHDENATAKFKRISSGDYRYFCLKFSNFLNILKTCSLKLVYLNI